MIIYKVTNLINNKIYIGKKVEDRKTYYGSGTAIKLAINKYGKKNFKKEILEKCNAKEELNKREIYWIEKLNSKFPNGYNLTDGGEGVAGVTEETKEKIKIARKKQIMLPWTLERRKKTIESLRGKKLSEKHKKKISLAHVGKKHTNETRRKMSLSRKGEKRTEKQKENMRKAWVLRKIKYGESGGNQHKFKS